MEDNIWARVGGKHRPSGILLISPWLLSLLSTMNFFHVAPKTVSGHFAPASVKGARNPLFAAAALATERRGQTFLGRKNVWHYGIRRQCITLWLLCICGRLLHSVAVTRHRVDCMIVHRPGVIFILRALCLSEKWVGNWWRSGLILNFVLVRKPTRIRGTGRKCIIHLVNDCHTENKITTDW